jgi:hypothetical protein
MSSVSKVPIERRRRGNVLKDLLRITKSAQTTPLRRESDQVKARLKRWIDLADRALGKSSHNNGSSH